MLFYPSIKQLTLDIAAECFLGIPLGPEADRLNRAFVIRSRPASVSSATLALHRDETRRRGGGKPSSTTCVHKSRNAAAIPIAPICSANSAARLKRMAVSPDDSILDHMNFLMMAAHDTITSSVTSFIYYLAKNPGVAGQIARRMPVHRCWRDHRY